jgi:hypothetical protein
MTTGFRSGMSANSSTTGGIVFDRATGMKAIFTLYFNSIACTQLYPAALRYHVSFSG